MIYQHIKAAIAVSFVLYMLTLPFEESLAADACNGDCVLQSAADDQNCAVEKTPLVRCEKFQEFQKRDSELNSAYKALYSSLSKLDQGQLKIAQRKWIKWRDDTCDDVEADANCTNGMCVGVAHDSCVVRLTERRRDELKQISSKSGTKADRFRFSESPLK
jgi:uncharacterized protein YecT (DUF1311 family)